MATVNYKCPNCDAPLTYNPEKDLFCCEYCESEFTAKEIQTIFKEKENQEGADYEQPNLQNDESDEMKDAVVYSCPSCGAEVITTSSTAATTCFYCQNPVVLGGRLSGDYRPDRIIPFSISKEKASEMFMDMCHKKKFLPEDFTEKKRIEKIDGVYFPYWYANQSKRTNITAKGEKIRRWSAGSRTYVETSIYQLNRSAFIDFANLSERALKSADRDMLNFVQPFDINKARPFAMSYLSGFKAEKRDIDKKEAREFIDKKVHEYCKQLLKDTMKKYSSIEIKHYDDSTVEEDWFYALLPVWVLTYKYKNTIYPFAINGQTGKTYGMLPTSKKKLTYLGVGIALGIALVGLLGGMLACLL